MPDSQSVDDEARHETQLERLDRNLEEMTGELRVAFGFPPDSRPNIGAKHIEAVTPPR
jgi:hypothetical protein